MTTNNLITQDLAAFTSLKIPQKNNNFSTNNITMNQRHALTTLMKLDYIIIKPADKCGQIVLQDRTSYHIEANRQLEDKNYCIPLPHLMQPETH